MTSKSARTRARILDAARAEFARRGFRGATIRAIASEAHIDPSMVIRYFDSKAGLFDAVCELGLRIPPLREVARTKIGTTLVRHFLTRWEGDTTDDSLLLLLRSATTDQEAAQRLHALFAGQLVPALADVIDDPAEVPARVGLVASQMLGVALTRSILQLPPMVAMTADQIVARVGPTVQAYLTSPLRPARAKTPESVP